MVAGVKSVLTNATLDALDLKVVNSASDWGYLQTAMPFPFLLGRWVQGPVKTLSTRRLEFGAASSHHVMCAWIQTTDRSLGEPGLAGICVAVTAVTSCTQASLHDFNSKDSLF